MFHQMISKARERWLESNECTIKDLIQYIERTGQMRDAQVNAIKTYLFLKIACGCRPLVRLFTEGTFNTENIGELPLPDRIKEYLRHDPAAATLLEYARLRNEKGKQVSETLEKQITESPDRARQKKLCKRRQATVKGTGANRGFVRAGQRLA